MFSFHQLTVVLLNTVYPSNLKDKEGNRIGGLIGKVERKNISMEQLILLAKQMVIQLIFWDSELLCKE